MGQDDTVAVVTGASSGIGEATSKALADTGCSVVLVARRKDRLEAIAERLDTTTLVVPTDVTDENAVESMVETVREELGSIDVLVNNAGVAPEGKVGEADLTQLHKPVRVNLEGVMTVTHAALPLMHDSGGGDIVTVSSLNARYPAEGASGYTASKFGVNGFCRSLRKEMADEPIRVMIVMPGPVITEINDWEHWNGRALDPVDVADTIMFAISRPDHVELTEVIVNTTDKM